MSRTPAPTPSTRQPLARFHPSINFCRSPHRDSASDFFGRRKLLLGDVEINSALFQPHQLKDFRQAEEALISDQLVQFVGVAHVVLQ